MEKSRDLTALEAIDKIRSMDKVGEIRKFSKGDSRKTVNDTAENKIDSLKSNKGKAKTTDTSKTATAKKKTPTR